MALYHKHRPQTFENVIGQAHIIKTITNQLLQGRVAHAYLFSGPRGIGKTTTARLMAKSLNCINKKEKSFEPCDICESCKEISGSRSIDVMEIDAASHTGVDNVRENIIENAQFRPTKFKHKIFIIDEAHMLSTAAFNALLKIMEEPPEYVVFILATTELHKLPETILSRCQRFDFKKVPYDTMKKHLEKIAKAEKIKIEKEVIDKIINKSDSCVRDAINLLDQVMATGEKNITTELASIVLPSSNVDDVVKFISFLIDKNASEAIKQINKLTDEGVNLPQFGNDVIELLRTIMISKASPNTELTNTDISKEIEKKLLKLSKEITPLEIINLIDLMIRRRQEIKSSPIPQLPLELGIVEWCQAEKHHINQDNSDSHNNTEDAKAEKSKINTVEKEINFSLFEVENKWSYFLDKIEKTSASLAFILKEATLSNVAENTIVLSVAFAFHRDKLMNKGEQKKIEDTLSEIMGSRIKIDVLINETAIEKNIKIDHELQNLTAAFGGEIIS